MLHNLGSHKVEISGGFWGCCSEKTHAIHTHTHINKPFTCAQYWDLATATRSLSMGCDWDTRGDTAWMTAVNLGYGLIPETQQRKPVNAVEQIQKKQHWRLSAINVISGSLKRIMPDENWRLSFPDTSISIFSERCYLKGVCQQLKNIDDLTVLKYSTTLMCFENAKSLDHWIFHFGNSSAVSGTQWTDD